MYAQERPVVKVGADHVPGTFEQQRRSGAQWRGEVDTQVTTREEPQRYLALDVFGEPNFVQTSLAATHFHGHGQRAARRRIDLSAKRKKSRGQVNWATIIGGYFCGIHNIYGQKKKKNPDGISYHEQALQ